ncbi:MAG: Panacea domain-containing protein [Patescibacteria group bacterium]|jgi:uncharacterized phage-associated protein
MIKLDYEKYKLAFLYLLNKMGKIEGKKKAFKMFYFLDFDFFEAYEKPFTGDTYIKKLMGPCPQYFESMADELEKDGLIVIKKERKNPEHENDTVIYQLKGNKKINFKFSTEEVKMLDRVANIYGPQTGKDLENLSHTQAPWLAVGLNEEIPYELSYYRGSESLTS